MNLGIKGLTLNDRFFELSELILFCRNEIEKGSKPNWELDVYRFILDFLNDSESVSQTTSGTTGNQKTIELPKKSMLASANNTIEYFQLAEGDVAVLCLPVKYIAGKMMVVRAMVAGLNLKLTKPSGTPDLSTINKIDFCAMVPMQAAYLLQKEDWPDIEILILGGAETGQELKEKFNKQKTRVFETYGMAETCSHVALKKITGDNPDKVFKALPEIRFSADKNECLIIDAPYLSGSILTSDRVEIISENSFLWLGRFDNVINSGGLKIQPETMESEIQDILQLPCAIIGKPDELLGQKVVLVLETKEKKDVNEIKAKLALHFDRKMLPKEIHLLSAFPRNQSFKIDRIQLKKQILKT